MPSMATKYRSGQAVLVNVKGEWLPGKVHKCYPKRLYQVHMTAGGYKTVPEGDIKLE